VREYWRVQAEADGMRKRQEEQLAAAAEAQAAAHNSSPRLDIAHRAGQLPGTEELRARAEGEPALR